MNEYRIMFTGDLSDSIKLNADTFVVTDGTVTFNNLIDDAGHLEPVAVFNMLDIVGFYKSF